MTLIERLEALSAPDRVADCLISAATGGVWGRDLTEDAAKGLCAPHAYTDEFSGEERTSCGADEYNTPRYTASIDSAMTLVSTPFWMIRNSMDGPVATIMDTSGREYEGNGDNAAIAMCIAALKARSADNG